jgi:hypothetical protein
MSYKIIHSVVSNTILHSKDVSLKAKGLYALLMTGVPIGDLGKYTTNTWHKEYEELEGLGLIVDGSPKIDLTEEVVYTPKKEKPEPAPKISKEEKGREFYLALTPFLKTDQNKKGYSPTMLRDFYDYWTESKETDSKLRFEKEKSWDLSRRLERWNKNDFKGTSNKEESTTYQSPKNNFD